MMIDNEYVKLTRWKNEPKYKNLKDDYDEAQGSSKIQIDKILMYRENMEGGKEIPKSVRDRGKSTQRPLVIRKQAEWAYPIMEEPFLSTQDMFNVQPNGPDDEEKAKINSMVLNWFMRTKLNKTQFIGEMVRTIYDEGTVIVKDGWHVEIDEVEVEYMEPVYGTPEESLMMLQQMVQSGQMDEAQAQAMLEMGEPVQVGEQKATRMEYKTVANHPTLEVCDSTNVIVDPTCEGDVRRAQFIIHEYETDYATLKAQEYTKEKIATADGVVKYEENGIYKNLDKVKFEEDGEQIDRYDRDKVTFMFKDKPRKKVKAYEYWGYWDISGKGELEPIVATWIGDVIVRMEKNPYPHQELPFSVARYMPRKKEFWGQPDGELLKENQETIGVYTRAMHDQTITNALGQTIVDETLFTSPSQWNAYMKGNTARSRPGANPEHSIWKIKIEPIDKSTFDMINYQITNAESITGQKDFSTSGISGSALGNSVGGIRTAMDATTKRKLGVLRRISDELLRNIARHVLMNAQEFMDEKTVMQLTDGEFVEVFKQDIQMEFDLRVEINTPEKEQEISDKIAFMLQTTMQTMPFDMSKALMKRWARVNKMPDVEKDLDEIEQPGPSPEEQQMQQMEMQKMKLELDTAILNNEKVKAEIAKLYADADRAAAHTSEALGRMVDDGSKAMKLESEANLKNAQAAKIASETDELDRRFLDEYSGAKRERENEDDQFKADVDMWKHEATIDNKPKDNK